MAEFFTKFDCLPIDHSHGNLCAWRGILDLYEITGNPRTWTRAKAKWDAAVHGGFVWPLGGVGEHWYVSFLGDEGCSESDWLRFNLDLWRFTGKTRYLDVAERLLQNQYATNQCPNGGYGMAHLDGDAAGPVAAIEKIEEWPFCCSFHGPLGLHFLKGYLAAGSERGVIVNFPYRFHRAGQGGRAGVVGFGPQQARLPPGPHPHGDRTGAAGQGCGSRNAPGANAAVGFQGKGHSSVPAKSCRRLSRPVTCGSSKPSRPATIVTVDFQSALDLGRAAVGEGTSRSR